MLFLFSVEITTTKAFREHTCKKLRRDFHLPSDLRDPN